MTRKIPIHLLSKEIRDLNNDQIEIIFDLPDINLPTYSKVSVASLWIGWKKPAKTRTFDATLSCSLVDSEINNFDQTILFFSESKSSRPTSVSPTHLIDYIIRSSSLKRAVFKIKFYIPLEKRSAKVQEEKSKFTSPNIEKIRLILLLDARF